MDFYRITLRRACRLTLVSRRVFHYRSQRRDDRALRKRIREIAETRVRYGFWRICILLKREGWPDNHKRIYRIYKEEGLNLRRKRPRRSKSAAHRVEQPVASSLHECWSMDFVADQLLDGRRFRALTIVDNYSRICLAIHAGRSLRGQNVVEVLDRIYEQWLAYPKRIQVDNGSEFISKVLDKWAYDNEVTLDFSRPGKPTDNPFIESFNGSFRDECLNVNWFTSMQEAQEIIALWREEYNHFRPHSSIGGIPPMELIQQDQLSLIS